MAKFDIAIPHVLAWEGGYVSHPADPGGATNRGITIGVFKKYAQSLLSIEPTLENLKALTEVQAKAIYKHAFWDRMQGDKIDSQQMASIMFDGFVNCGANGIKMMQRVIGVKEDGIFGPNSLSALNTITAEKDAEIHIYTWYKGLRKQYYENLAERKPAMKVFLKGWLNRIESFPDLE